MNSIGLKHIKFTVIIFIIFFNTCDFIFSQTSFENDSFYKKDTIVTQNQMFYQFLYQFSFEEADSVMQIANKNNAYLNNNLMQAYLLWWKVLSGENMEININKCEQVINANIDYYFSNKKLINKENYLTFLQSSIMKLRIANYRNQKVAGFSKLVTLKEEFNNLTQKSQPTPDEKLLLGMYLYFYEYVKEKYPISRLLLNGMTPGDKQLGISYLEQCSNSSNQVLKTQGNYFLYKIYNDIQADYLKSLEYITFLKDKYPENLVYMIEYYKTLVKTGNLQKSKMLQNKLVQDIHGASHLSKQQKNHFLEILKNLEI
ncbi:MAG TPA: hypothetical protein ENK91_05905 [Bacteroidetes bacterium]|nr:hypothetical protein [Bacteroidota bacterium]